MKNVFLTFDIENNRGRVPTLMTGHGMENPASTSWIMDQLERFNFKGVFYVNVYEWNKYEENYVESLVKEIHHRGHEVALHNHYIHANKNLNCKDYEFYKKDLNLYDAKAAEIIIKYGVDLIKSWTGLAPVSFRAGALKIDRSTYIALARCNIKFDSSVMNGEKNCQSVYYSDFSKVDTICSVKVFPISKYESSMFSPESKAYGNTIKLFEKINEKDPDAFVYIGHSFSFYKTIKDAKPVTPDAFLYNQAVVGNDDEKMNRFIEFLDYLRQFSSVYKVTTFKDLSVNYE